MGQAPAPQEKESYQKLLQHIRQEIQTGQQAIERFIDRQKVKTHWQVGCFIDEHIGKHANDPTFSHVDFYKGLAEDLDVTYRFLQQTVQFYQTYPQLNLEQPFSWTHYVVLISMPNNRVRRQWEKRIVKHGWNATETKNAWRAHQQQALPDATKVEVGVVDRGQLYLYRIVQKPHLHGATARVIDLGFNMHYDFPSLMKPSYHSGKLIQSFWVDGQYQLKQVQGGRSKLYTYKAHIVRVVDGDTLLVDIDGGFGMWRQERLRLRGIDAPEMSTTAGRDVKKHLEQKLSACPFVVIKTYGSDKYDRYLVDVFYKPDESDATAVAAQGRLLNHELLEAGLVSIWQA